MTEAMQSLAVSRCGRYLEQADGTPFFWLADTAWELFHKLTREEAEVYLDIRAEQGFTVVQAVALAELDGIRKPNAYGRLPLHPVEGVGAGMGQLDAQSVHGESRQEGSLDTAADTASALQAPASEDRSAAVDAAQNLQALPDYDARPRADLLRADTDGPYSYWDHVDAVIELAAERGIYIALLPTWGDKFNRKWGIGPELFAPDHAYAYGRWLGERYRDRANLIWVLGGDRPLESERHREIVDRMAAGLREGDGGHHLMTFHPPGAATSADYVHDRDWLDFHMIQSGHGEAEITNHLRVQRDYARMPVRPVLDGEPCYEDHPIAFRAELGYFDAADVRRAAYYAALSGACGHTYGHHSVWSMSDGMYASAVCEEQGVYIIMSWKEALLRPGAEQMRHLRALLESGGWGRLTPDQELLPANLAGAAHCVAARNGGEALVYTPFGLYIDICLDRLGGGAVRASWYDPRDGSRSDAGVIKGGGVQRFYAPTSGRGEDWVLCLREEARGCTR
ncbi:hypothetical protein PA598K_06214 [Paenibacillus sp. 598K]|uniref:glycoside hydrolase family 140 protein n=1 Tax=Paenibacillus sp. 598K TaxID=1117987 RepID=UPI000FFAC8EA|nr:glycoside hydrolase family 140 protein [Paenibacillus sp. 598K]GBF77654.1 hypothetical protein PA598K_06214 [Paenibacillus sp. 598K]